jgi:DNA-binding response OmpR family regulator
MAANHELSPQYNHTQTLLIIEDHTELRQYLQNNFQTTYRVLTAFDGEQGKEIAIAEIPDLVITDLMLPKLDGMEVCRALKGEEKTSHIPVVMLTARSEIKSRIEGLESGADDYIAKPFDFGELNARVENLLETRKRLREKFSKQLSVSPRPIETLSLDDQFLQKAIGIVEDNISNPSFSVDAFAKEAAMSSAQLYRKVTALTEFTPNDLIRHMRLQRAADLLRRRAGNVADVAYQSGFTSLSYFSKCFREKFGIVPSEYMKSTVLEGSGTIS